MRLLIPLTLFLSYVAGIVLPILKDVGTQVLLNSVEIDQKQTLEVPDISGPALLFTLKNPVQGRYIVVLNDGVSIDDFASHTAWVKEMTGPVYPGSTEIHTFRNDHFSGYIGMFEENLLNTIRENPLVKYVEQDGLYELQETNVQTNATWGLSRISTRERTGLNSYIHYLNGGEGVITYTIDGGLQLDEEFEGRASHGKAFSFLHASGDYLGHGTHVAGIIGSKTWGVAKKAQIVSVSVVNFYGGVFVSDVIKALDWVVQEHKRRVRLAPKGFKGSTINLSIGGPGSQAFDDSVNAASNAGLHVVVAAGNDDVDACKESPARANRPITVGATDINDARTSFSNYGKCVDVYAPGMDIESVGLISSPMKMSGTSMAAPHVTGLLSYFLSLQPGLNSEFAVSLAKPADVKRRFLHFATKNTIQGLPEGSINLLAFNGAAEPLLFWEE